MKLLAGLVIAMAAASAGAAAADGKDENSPGDWRHYIAYGRACSVSSDAGGEAGNVRLSLDWGPGQPQRLRASWAPEAGAIVIGVAGMEESFTLAPRKNDYLLEGAPLEALKRSIARGAALVATSPAHPGKSTTARSTNGPASMAMFDACVESLTLHAPATDASLERGAYQLDVTPASCTLRRWWRDSVWLYLRARPGGGLIDVGRPMSDHGPRPKGPFTADLTGLGGQRGTDMRILRFDLTLAALDDLELALVRGESRTFTIEQPQDAMPDIEELDFGGPFARAPAAMFAACRRQLFGRPGID